VTLIITRTPLRISIGGGGTDLPSYYQENGGGFVISAAINKYVYITINRSFLPGYFLKYSETEHTENCDQIRHPLIREAIRAHHAPSPLEVVSVADVPAGTGLGSSGTFLVGLLHALYAWRRHPVTAETLAREAVDIEMNRLGEPVGKQDQYIAAYGGLLCQEYLPDGEVRVTPLSIPEESIHELRDSLMLFFLGELRSASSLLSEQKRLSEARDQAMIDSLHFARMLGREIRTCLESGHVAEFGRLMHEHWMRKRNRSRSMSSTRIDSLYDLARSDGGATGGKLVGAGGSGFLLLHTHDRRRLRDTMLRAGLTEMDFSFDFDGSVVLLRNG
jgi:D-glycero-alpha-D-manno-heptose-7-phosphate kinase